MPRSRQPSSRQPAAVPPETATQILDVAERLAQTRGFNGFSYADIASELGITKASLHYHYATKADLGRALIDRYASTFAAALASIEENGQDAAAMLEQYVQIYASVLHAGRICLCGMLAAEYTTLPDAMQAAIRNFFDMNEQWLSRVLEGGRRNGSLKFDESATEAARAITSALEGAMLLARPYGGVDRFVGAATRVLREFTTTPRSAKPARRK